MLTVLDAVARLAPCRLDGVVAATRLPRSAVYRCLTTLEEEGWIRRRLGSGAFQLTHLKQAQFSGTLSSEEFVDRIAPMVAPLASSARIDIDVALLNAPGEVCVVETSRREPLGAEEFFASPLTLAVLMVLPPDQRLAHVRAAMEQAAPEDRAAVTSGRFTRALSKAAQLGYVWDVASGGFCLPLDDGAGATGALRLEGGGSTKRSENRLHGLAEGLRRSCPTLLPDTATVLARYWPTLDLSRIQTPLAADRKIPQTARARR